MHPSGHVDSGSGVRRPFTIQLSTDALESIGHRINFIGNWIQRFSVNDEFRTFYTKIICYSYSRKLTYLFL